MLKESTRANQGKEINVANTQEVNLPNIGETSSMGVCKNSDSVETPNNILTTKNREIKKTTKISNRKTREKKNSTLFLVGSIFKNMEMWRLNTCLKSFVHVKATLQRETIDREKQ